MRGMRRYLVVVLAALCAARAVRAETPDTERRLRALEQALHDAQAEIQRLRAEVREQQRTGAVQAEAARTAQAEQTRQLTEEVKKSVSLPDWLKRVALFGDLRLRHEGFYHQPSATGTTVTARNRERFRARVGLKATLSDELSATVRIATGNANDPISTNQTFDNNFTPKSINLDWGYLTFAPGKTFGIRPGLVALTGGKFPNPIFRTDELVFDDDLSLEGFTETAQLLDRPYGPLQQVRVHGIQGSFREVSNGQDGWLFAEQVNPLLRFGRTDVELGVGQYTYLNEDLIARSLASNSSLVNTNVLKTMTSGGTTSVTGYASSFNLTNVTGGVTFPDVIAGLPVRVFADYVHNWEAATSNADGALGGARLGQTKVRGDWAVSAFYEYLEQEATLSTFTWSDFGLGGTNNQGPVVALDYQLLDPLTVTWRNYFVNRIDSPAGVRNPTLWRLQLDAVVKF
jgi:hypothetical protein